jgi:drug/metabolite transporter (DMT)-like permease
MLWMAASGMAFAILNTAIKWLAQDIHPWVVGSLRYFFGFVVLLPLIWRLGLGGLATRAPGLTALRCLFHSGGLMLWFYAVPMVSMAEMTALGFTGPIFMCLGAVLVLGERMSWARWAAVLMGFIGVLVVVRPWSGGGFSGVTLGNLLMLASSPVFAGSFLTAKVLTRHDSSEVIVLWQHLGVGLMTLPLAVIFWSNPTLEQWFWIVVCGVLGTVGHYCINRAFVVADVSAVQPVRFLDLVWASLGGFLVFSTIPHGWTLVGAAVIFASTLWLARHESRLARGAGQQPGGVAATSAKPAA